LCISTISGIGSISLLGIPMITESFPGCFFDNSSANYSFELQLAKLLKHCDDEDGVPW